jgi:hypothetical protein
MVVELGPLCGGQFAKQVFMQKLGEFAAVHKLRHFPRFGTISAMAGRRSSAFDADI